MLSYNDQNIIDEENKASNKKSCNNSRFSITFKGTFNENLINNKLYCSMNGNYQNRSNVSSFEF